jgi:glycosyltransferase involved in cell wall biosynthesis
MITTIHNPINLERVTQLAREPAEHPWFEDADIPVVLGVGRLVPQKDFPTLMRAFALVRQQRPARLVILGQGRGRPELEALARSLGLEHDLWMPGIALNPYRYMARAAVFALSSAWEGFGNVLLESLACGRPIVSTDCPSGPAEILGNGRFGRLVPVGDAPAMASAILESLAGNHQPDRLRSRAAEFSIERTSQRYLELLLGPQADAALSCSRAGRTGVAGRGADC